MTGVGIWVVGKSGGVVDCVHVGRSVVGIDSVGGDGGGQGQWGVSGRWRLVHWSSASRTWQEHFPTCGYRERRVRRRRGGICGIC